MREVNVICCDGYISKEAVRLFVCCGLVKPFCTSLFSFDSRYLKL